MGHQTMIQKLITLGGGFLLAVLWFDLMFDVQVWAHWGTPPLPDHVLESIGGYYQRVTTDAAPMNLLVGIVMIVLIVAAIWNGVRGAHALWVRISTLLLLFVPIAAAQLVIFPNAQRLAARADDLGVQTDLANSIFLTHVLCFVAIALMLTLQFLPERRGSD